MKLTKYYWITLIVMTALFFYPHASAGSEISPVDDGCWNVFGFPIPFYQKCAFLGPSLSRLYLFVDLLILLAVPLVVNYIVEKRHN